MLSYLCDYTSDPRLTIASKPSQSSRLGNDSCSRPLQRCGTIPALTWTIALEQQAQIVEDWFVETSFCGLRNTGTPKGNRSPYDQFIINNVRQKTYCVFDLLSWL